jgi:hypothetical protein
MKKLMLNRLLLVFIISLIFFEFLPVASAAEDLTWVKTTDTAPWNRYYFASCSYAGKLWVFGGNDGGILWNDAWWSINGTTWYEANASCAWSVRHEFSALVFDGKMWIIGGSDYVGQLGDVWYSTDGAEWTQALAGGAGWVARGTYASCVFNGSMWLMGGWWDAVGFLNDAWYSSDGVNWNMANATCAWSSRRMTPAVVYDNKMWIFAGFDGTVYNDTWYSTDGAEWIQATPAANWTARYAIQSAVYDNKMWIMGGVDVIGLLNDTWYSTDGINWTNTTELANWSARYGGNSEIFRNSMWIIGGADAFVVLGEAWYTYIPPPVPPFVPYDIVNNLTTYILPIMIVVGLLLIVVTAATGSLDMRTLLGILACMLIAMVVLNLLAGNPPI